jgi:hypothetical protein
MFSPPPSADRSDVSPEGDETSAGADTRPAYVLAGCVLAWVGAIVGSFNGALFLTVNESTRFVRDMAAADRAGQITFYHWLGIALAMWCLILAVVTYFAFRRDRWAARALVAMGIIWVLVNIFNGLSGAGLGVVIGSIWTIASITFVYFVRQSREWYASRDAMRF